MNKSNQHPLAQEARALPDAASSALDAAHVPGESGMPLVGHTFSFLFRTRALMDGLRERHGANFRMRMFGVPVLILGGPLEAREALLDREKNFSSAKGWQLAIGQLFKRGLMLRDFEEHSVHRRIMQVAFRTSAMRTYTGAMSPVIEQTIDALPSRVACFPMLKQLTLDIAAKVFLGLTLGREADALNRAFVDAVAASVAVVKREVPGLAFARGMRGRRLLEAFFRDRIAGLREGDASHMFAELCRARSEDGEQFSDEEIVDHMIFLMMAAHDTTTSSLSSLVYALAENMPWQERVREELRAHGPTPLGWDDRDGLPLLDRCFDEALRCYPPVPFIARRSVRDCQVGSLRIPANTQVGVCSVVTHRLPEFWPEPDTFDPDRFLPARAEAIAKAHAYYPFGGGAHTCIGLHFARMQVKAVLQALLTRYRITLAQPGRRTRMAHVPIPYPRDGLPISLTRLGAHVPS